jgi:hypothetical protein
MKKKGTKLKKVSKKTEEEDKEEVLSILRFYDV